MFDEPTKNFQIVVSSSQEVDTFCTDGPDNFQECEIYLQRKVAPLSHQMLIVTFNALPAFETKIFAFGFDIKGTLISNEKALIEDQ